MGASVPPSHSGPSRPSGPPSPHPRPVEPPEGASDSGDCSDRFLRSGLLDRKLITVIGKGGVGKTTVAAALAVMAARRGLRVLLAAVQAKSRLGDMLGSGPIGPHIREVWPGVEAVDMVPEVNLEEYALMTLKLRSLYRLVIGNSVVQSLLAGVPGLYQWSLLGKVTFHALEQKEDGTPRYDLVILDAPATGHGLDLLRVPLTITEAIPSGPLREEALERWELLTDPDRHEVLPVTLAEEMAVAETFELVGRLEAMGLTSRSLVVNKLLPPLFRAEDSEQLASLELDGPFVDVIAAGRVRATWQRIQAEQMKRLERLLEQKQIWIPHMLVPTLGPETVTSLSYALEALMAAPSAAQAASYRQCVGG